MEQTATNAVETAKRLFILFQKDEQKIHAVGRSASTSLRVFRVMCRRPLLNLKHVCHHTGLSFPAATKAMQSLEKLDLVREITGQERNRVFAYHSYLNILNEGTETR